MKKHYIRISIVISLLILAAFVLAGCFYTYVMASKAMKDYMDEAKIEARVQMPASDSGMHTEPLVKELYTSCWRNASVFGNRNLGFYGYMDLGNGISIRSEDFLMVYKLYEHTTLHEGIRIIPVDDSFDFSSRDLYDFEIEGMCDETYIYRGRLLYQPDNASSMQYYTIGVERYDPSGPFTTYEEWAGEDNIHVEFLRMADSEEKASLNAEAEDLCEDFVDGDILDREKDDIFTSYYISVRNYSDSRTVYGVYVFHPVRIAVSANLSAYIVGLVSLLIIEGAVGFMMIKMYRDRVRYENQRDELTRSIAHDLKTPLAVAKAYVENWEYIDEEDRPEYSERLAREVDNMTGLVNELLDKSKMDSGKRSLKLEEVEMFSLTKALFDQMKPIISERGLRTTLQAVPEDGSFAVNADLSMMKIVIGNFLSNAVKFCDKKVDVKITSREKKILFEVSNDGARIDKKELKKVWDAFYKTDKARTDRFGSSGMGLSICKSILELHKARYGCTSDVYKTTFWFEMNRVRK